jgi:hypothetical protein
MRAAIKLVRDYFWPHARAALRQIGLSDRHVNARRALRWIKAHRRPQQKISIEGIRVDALARKLDAAQTSDLLAVMERSGWLREKKDEDGLQGRGRPARRWEANPLLWSPEIPEIPENPYPAAAIEPNPTLQGISGISGISGKHNDMAAATGAVNGSDEQRDPPQDSQDSCPPDLSALPASHSSQETGKRVGQTGAPRKYGTGLPRIYGTPLGPTVQLIEKGNIE